MLDLVLPLECGGCGAPSTTWCDACAAALKVHTDEPHLVTPRIDPGVPVFALGHYAGPRRQAIVALKEHGRRDLVAPLARALALGIHQLVSWGILDTPFTIVPAPTRALAARRRGGDPVTRVAQRATHNHPDIAVVRALRTRALVRDSVGLTSADRERNLTGRVKIDKASQRRRPARRRHRHHRRHRPRSGPDAAKSRGECNGRADPRARLTRPGRSPV